MSGTYKVLQTSNSSEKANGVLSLSADAVHSRGVNHSTIDEHWTFSATSLGTTSSNPAMVQAGPSNPKKQKKKQPHNGIRSSKLKKVAAVKSIEALEESAMQYVSASRECVCLSVLID